MTVASLAPILEGVTGVKAPTRQIPMSMLYLIAGVNETWARMTRQPIFLSLSTVRLMAQEDGRTTFDHSRRELELGLHFRPVEETLRDEVAWYREHGWLPANGPQRKRSAGRMV
jgi:dihydroflavonol-4-reductase